MQRQKARERRRVGTGVHSPQIMNSEQAWHNTQQTHEHGITIIMTHCMEGVAQLMRGRPSKPGRRFCGRFPMLREVEPTRRRKYRRSSRGVSWLTGSRGVHMMASCSVGTAACLKHHVSAERMTPSEWRGESDSKSGVACRAKGFSGGDCTSTPEGRSCGVSN